MPSFAHEMLREICEHPGALRRTFRTEAASETYGLEHCRQRAAGRERIRDPVPESVHVISI